MKTNDLNKKVAEHVSKLMQDNSADWERRYKDYLEKIKKNYKIINYVKRRLHVETPLTLYSSISDIKKISSNFVHYDVRVWGHSIGNIVINLGKNKNEINELLNKDGFSQKDITKLNDLIDKNGGPQFVIKVKNTQGKYYANYNSFKLLIDYLKNSTLQNALDTWVNNNLSDNRTLHWNSKEMTEMRSILQKAQTKQVIEISSEHSCENLLLRALAEKNSKMKYIQNIQPIKLADCLFFQMPTCLKGSNAKKIEKSGSVEQIKYSGKSGGGIDILAKIKKGNKVELCVIELKDKYEKSERPVVAIRQAIAYAVCLDYILRSEYINKNELNWYQELTGSKSQIQNNININVVVAMPYMENITSVKNISSEDKDLAKQQIPISVFGHDDTLTLHYLFFKNKKGEEALKQNRIENGIVTSLPIKQNN